MSYFKKWKNHFMKKLLLWKIQNSLKVFHHMLLLSYVVISRSKNILMVMWLLDKKMSQNFVISSFQVNAKLFMKQSSIRKKNKCKMRIIKQFHHFILETIFTIPTSNMQDLSSMKKWKNKKSCNSNRPRKSFLANKNWMRNFLFNLKDYIPRINYIHKPWKLLTWVQ